MIFTSAIWTLVDDEYGRYLSEGDNLTNFTYFDENEDSSNTLNNVTVQAIDKDTITLIDDDWKETTIDIDFVEEWEV